MSSTRASCNLLDFFTPGRSTMTRTLIEYEPGHALSTLAAELNILPKIIIRDDIPHFFNAQMQVVLLAKKKVN